VTQYGPTDEEFDRTVENARMLNPSSSAARLIPFRPSNADLDAQVVNLDAKAEADKTGKTVKTPDSKLSGEPDWPDVTVDKHGLHPKKTYRNAREAIKALGITCAYDEFHDRHLVGGEPIQQWAGELSDAATTVLRQMIVENFGFDPGKENINDAATALCLENRFNPILDYLDALKWDGVPRLETWQTTYLGAEDTPLNRAIGRLTLVAAVRRVRKPGCKFDQIPVWEGAEGSNKSTAIAVLAGEGNFSDQTILTANDKEQQELLRGVWIYEIADLAGMKRSEVEKVKAFASRTHDRARPAYGRRRVDAGRRGILIGTTNDDQYLKSETGNRRFWPLTTGTIDIESLHRDRDQLWAEAAAVEKQGGSLALPRELWATAAAVQDDRRQHDPWDDSLANFNGIPRAATDGSGELQEWTRVSEILAHLGVTLIGFRCRPVRRAKDCGEHSQSAGAGARSLVSTHGQCERACDLDQKHGGRRGSGCVASNYSSIVS
jgi:predicted P-loop ATPase